MVQNDSLPITFENETLQEQTASTSTEIFTTIVRDVSKLTNLFMSFQMPLKKVM